MGLVATVPAVVAQQVGTYEGQTEDGSWVTFEVDLNNETGNYRLYTFTYDYVAICDKKGNTHGTTITFGLADDIIDGKVPLALQTSTRYLSGQLVFDGTDNAFGHFEHREAIFVPRTPPKRSQYCIAKQRKFTASFIHGGVKKAVRPGDVREADAVAR